MIAWFFDLLEYYYYHFTFATVIILFCLLAIKILQRRLAAAERKFEDMAKKLEDKWEKEENLKQHHLSNGACADRFMCKNVNTEKCHCVPVLGQDYVLCRYYEKREEK